MLNEFLKPLTSTNIILPYLQLHTSRLHTLVAQILMNLRNRRNILAPQMAMAVMVNVRLV